MPRDNRFIRWVNRNAMILKLIGGVYFATGFAWVMEDITDGSLFTSIFITVLGIILLIMSGEIDDPADSSGDD